MTYYVIKLDGEYDTCRADELPEGAMRISEHRTEHDAMQALIDID